MRVRTLCLLAAAAGAAAAAPAPDPERSLAIIGASGAVARSTVRGPQFHAPETMAPVEDYHHPRLKRLREEYGLEQVVAGEPVEFRRLLKLRHWVHTRWKIDNEQTLGGDAFAILEAAKRGEGFHCSHSMTVQHAVLVSLGYIARDLGVDRNHEDMGRSIHHGVNEVWSNDHAKWVLMDAKYDIHFERDGVPLSALELHEAVRADGGRGIVKLRGVERTPAPMEIPSEPEGSVRGYWWVSYNLRPQPFTQPHWTGNGRLLILENEAFRSTTWHRSNSSGLVKHWAYAARAFVPARSRHEIEWTPGVTELRARQAAEGEIEVQLRSATPNFKQYLARTDGGAWRPLEGDRTVWRLRPGENRLEARTENLSGVRGPVAAALIDYRPPAR